MTDAALDATADALARRALAALPDTVGRADLAGLAPPLGRLLAARLDAVVAQGAPGSPWVDPDDARVAAARQSWREAALAVARVPAAARDSEVRRAAVRALSHLVRPADTLAAVAFEGEGGPLPTAVVLARMRAFAPYPYLAQITERYVERKDLSYIDRAGLERLLRRIDRRMVSAFGPDDWLALLAPLFELAGPVGRPAGSVPTALLRTLFEAKGAADLDDALDEIDAVDADTLRTLIARALPTSAPAGPAAPSAPLAAPDAPPSDEPLAEPAPGAEAPPAGAPPADGTVWSTAPPLPPAPERQRNPWEGETETEPPDVSPEPPAGPSPEAASGDEETVEDGVRPPVIGSRYGTPEFDGVHGSEVIGQARPVQHDPAPPEPVRPDPDAASPMEAVRDAVTEGPPADPAPPVPVLDLPPPDSPGPQATAASEPPASEVPAPPEPLAVEPDGVDPTAPAPDPPPAASGAGPTAGDDAGDEPLWARLARQHEPPPAASGAAPPAAPTPVDDDVPLWKRFAQSDLAERLPEPGPAGPSIAEAAERITATPAGLTPAGFASDTSPPLPDPPAAPAASGSELAASDGAPPEAPSALDGLEVRVLGDDARDKRDWFVAELFGGSPGEYHRTLGVIDRAATYTEATAVISAEVLRKRRVSPYTDCAVAFIDAVQDGFDRR